MLIASN